MAHDSGNHGHHIIPIPTLTKTFAGLIALTLITVGLAQFDLGIFEVPAALGLASSKTALVVMIFMALKYDNPVNTLTFIVGVLFVGVFVTFTLLDTAFRGDLDNVDPMTIQEREQLLQELEQEANPNTEELPESSDNA
ncbi:MAG: cytochrome C oxidase subunit IV family protein [Longimonas sp.]|uniref:cytochrome C oxidase subunit IV family protein n=1 Tax=Longimonas sp. TaxID=2039626 RepID=UPI003359B7A4